MAGIKPLLQGIFLVQLSSGGKWTKCHVILNKIEIRFEELAGDQAKISSSRIINLYDTVGCSSDRNAKETSDTNVSRLKIYSYPQKKKFGSKKAQRHRCVTTINFGLSGENQSQNIATWKSVIMNIIHGTQISEDVSEILSLPMPKCRRFLVLVNPFGGAGKAAEIFQEKVAPMLAEGNCTFNLVITERAGHAQELVSSVDVKDWDAIVIVSGDGLIYEVIQGLMSRADWKEAILTPLGIIPGGSGNALACTLLHSCGEPYLENAVLHATFMLLKFNVRPMDLVAIDTGSGKRLYSFLSVGWALISDVDIESEKYRSLGGARFTVGAFVRILGLRSYAGKLSFLPVDKYEPPPRKSRLPRSKSVVAEADNNPKAGCTLPCRSQSVVDSAIEAEEDGDNCFLASQNNEHVVDNWKKLVQSYSEVNANSSLNFNQSGDIGNTPTSNKCEPFLKLPDIKDPVPSDWVTINDDFVLVVAVYLSHLASDMIAAPESELDDGLIYLAFAPTGISRYRLTSKLLAMQDGSHTSGHGLEIVKVKAFRLEPLTEKGRVTVDGEAVDYGPIQGSIMPSAARVVCLPSVTRL